MPQEADVGNPSIRTVTITGDPQSCEAAKMELESLCSGGHGPGAQQVCYYTFKTVYISVYISV